MQQTELPLVSVVVPCFNHSKFIAECLNSICLQTYPRIELIVIDDGSKDSSPSSIRPLLPLCKARFERFEFIARENRGLAATLNEGLAWCRGEFYSPIASDDFMLPEKLESQIRYMAENIDCIAVFGGANVVNSDSEVVRTLRSKPCKLSFDELLLMKRSVIAPTGMIRMNAMRAIAPIPPDIGIEDWYTYLRITEKGGRIHITDSVYVGYRRHPTNTSNKIALMADERFKILSRYDSHRLINLARAQSSLLSAAEYWRVDRRVSFAWLRRAFSYSTRTLLTERFWLHVLRMLAPQSMSRRRW